MLYCSWNNLFCDNQNEYINHVCFNLILILRHKTFFKWESIRKDPISRILIKWFLKLLLTTSLFKKVLIIYILFYLNFCSFYFSLLRLNEIVYLESHLFALGLNVWAQEHGIVTLCLFCNLQCSLATYKVNVIDLLSFFGCCSGVLKISLFLHNLNANVPKSLLGLNSYVGFVLFICRQK